MKRLFDWGSNPFSFKILPELFVGYGDEVSTLETGIRNGDKFALLLGPTGSGKTTLLRHISARFSDYKVIYLPKPPKDPQDWTTVFKGLTRPGLLGLLFRRENGVDLYTLSARVNRKLGSRRCLLFVDECHEATQESLEWLRTITDQVDNLTVVLAGLPIFENSLRESLETFLRRVTLRVDLGCLTQAETREFIKKRIEQAGGEDIKPFTSSLVEHIHEKTGGFPREILRACNELYQKALERGLTTIDTDFLKEAQIESRVSREDLEALPSRQKLIIDILVKEGELTPTEMVEKVRSKGEYKDKDNAVRSVNNLVRRLMTDGYVERKKIGKAYKYRISPRYRTLLVTA